MSYDVYSLYHIRNVRPIVQEPARSTNFKVSPQGVVGTDSDRLRIHTYNQADIGPGAPLHFDISYTKKDTRPSIGGSSGGGPNTTVLIVLGVIAILVVVFIMISRLRSKRPQPVASRSLRRQAARTAKGGQVKNKHCRYCGKPVQEADRFCPYCGKKSD